MKSPIGRYYPHETIIHKIDPRLKLIINIIYIVLTFIVNYFVSLAVLLVPLMIAFVIGSRKIYPLFRLMIMPLIIGFFILFVNIYTMKLNPGSVEDLNYTRIIPWGGHSKYALTLEALARTGALIIRIYIMIMVTSLLLITTKPILLTKALEDLMFLFKLLFIPTHIIAMIISIALRFIPTLFEEAQRIMKAQASRGVDFKNGKIKEKVKSFTTLIIPLFVTSFAKAEDLSNAMETRGYDPYAKRTRYRKLRIGWLDVLFFILIVGLILFVAFSQSAKYDFLPFWYKFTYFKY